MDAPLIPPNESQRLKSLQQLNILDSPSEGKYDRITKAVSEMFDVPIVLVSLIDSNRQWFKSKVGLEVSETPRNISFCGHAILSNDALVIPDTLKDKRFFDNPLVTGPPNIRFYAGQPISSPSGENIGTLCLIDSRPRDIPPSNLLMLKRLSSIIELELANKNRHSLCPETGFYNSEGFHQIADSALSVCRQSALPVCVVYFFVSGLISLKHTNEAQYAMAIKVLIEAFTLAITKSDFIARYDDNGFVLLLSNSNHGSAMKKVAMITETVQTQLAINSLRVLKVISGVVEDNGVDDLEKLILNSFMLHYENSAI